MSDQLNKYNMGDKCADGIIAGILSSLLYIKLAKVDDYHRWDKEYPEWRNKFIYYVLFTKPRPVCSEEEFYTQFPYGKFIKEECKSDYFNELVAKSSMLTIPEDAI